MKVIGLTGGMASGKSTVANYLRELGYPIFDADYRAKELTRPGSPCLAKVAAIFGERFLEKGVLNREKLAEHVFSDHKELAKLNELIHSEVWRVAQEFIAQHKKQGAKMVILDVPLLVQTGWHERVDEVWAVVIPRDEQIKRAMARNGMSREMAQKRLDSQISNEELVRYAHVVIDNSGSLVKTLEQVDKVLGVRCH